MTKNLKYTLKFVPIIFMMGMFFCACENDLNEVKVVTASDDTPDEIVNDLHMMYSDSGIVKFEIIATRTETYKVPANKTLFKNGFEVRFYKHRDSLVSVLTAEYGELHKAEARIVARNNVIFKNFEKGKTLKTEELHWDQTRKKVKTDKQFEIFGEDMYGVGKGIECDETFDTYKANDTYVEYDIDEK